MPGGFLAGFLVAINSRALLLRGWIYNIDKVIGILPWLEIDPKKMGKKKTKCVMTCSLGNEFPEDTAICWTFKKKTCLKKKMWVGEQTHFLGNPTTPECAQCTVYQVETFKDYGFSLQKAHKKWNNEASWWLNQPIWKLFIKIGIGMIILKKLKPPGKPFVPYFWSNSCWF